MIVCLKAEHVQIIARVDVIAFSSMSASQTSKERKKGKKRLSRFLMAFCLIFAIMYPLGFHAEVFFLNDRGNISLSRADCIIHYFNQPNAQEKQEDEDHFPRLVNVFD